MSKIVGCSLIIRDDFNNVLILKKKVKRGQKEEWSLLNQKIKGKETTEKCVNRGVKDVLKSIVFDLKPLNEYILNEDTEDIVMTFVGTIKEKVTLDKNYKEYKWISNKNINQYDFTELDMKILEDFFR